MLRKFAIAAFCLVSASLRAEVTDTIKPGVKLDAAYATLSKFGYHFGERYRLAIIASDKDHDLAFCQLDDNSTLLLGYRLSTKEIESLDVINLPEDKPKLLRTEVHIPLLAIQFEPGGVHSLKIKRNAIRVQLPAKNAPVSK